MMPKWIRNRRENREKERTLLFSQRKKSLLLYAKKFSDQLYLYYSCRAILVLKIQKKLETFNAIADYKEMIQSKQYLQDNHIMVALVPVASFTVRWLGHGLGFGIGLLLDPYHTTSPLSLIWETSIQLSEQFSQELHIGVHHQ